MWLFSLVMGIALLGGCVSEKRAKQAAYFAKECEKEGYLIGTAEHDGCVSVMQDRLRGPIPGAAGTMQNPAGSATTTCHTTSSGRSTICY